VQCNWRGLNSDGELGEGVGETSSGMEAAWTRGSTMVEGGIRPPHACFFLVEMEDGGEGVTQHERD
jgi:hypothetical protein